MTRIGPFILLAALVASAIHHHRVKRDAPDPYAPCAAMASETERGKCRSQIDFAMSAGW